MTKTNPRDAALQTAVGVGFRAGLAVAEMPPADETDPEDGLYEFAARYAAHQKRLREVEQIRAVVKALRDAAEAVRKEPFGDPHYWQGHQKTSFAGWLDERARDIECDLGVACAGCGGMILDPDNGPGVTALPSGGRLCDRCSPSGSPSRD